MVFVVDKSKLIDDVCSKCPGSLWGQKSICRIHNLSIGQIKECPEWEHHASLTLKDHDGQLALFDLEPALEIVQKVEEDLKDYQMMIKERDRLWDYLDKAISVNSIFSEKLTASYGIEATLPKPKGKKLGELTIDESRFERTAQRYIKIRDKITKINEAILTIHDEKQRTVIECMIDGVKMHMIARHVGVSRTRLNEIKRAIVKDLAWKIYGEELTG